MALRISNTIMRVIAGALALVAAPIAARDLYGMFHGAFDLILAVFAVCTTAFVVLCAWFAWRGNLPASRARLKGALLGGLALGAVGFVIGFFGPLILAPDANQGPLLGIFVTGPIGVVIGAVVGWLLAGSRVPARP